MKRITASQAQPGVDYLTTHDKTSDPPGPFRVRMVGRDQAGNVELLLVHNGVTVAVGPSYPLQELAPYDALPPTPAAPAAKPKGEPAPAGEDAGEEKLTLYGLVKDILIEGGCTSDQIAEQVRVVFPDVTRSKVTEVISCARKSLREKGINVVRDKDGKYNQKRSENGQGERGGGGAPEAVKGAGGAPEGR